MWIAAQSRRIILGTARMTRCTFSPTDRMVRIHNPGLGQCRYCDTYIKLSAKSQFDLAHWRTHHRGAHILGCPGIPQRHGCQWTCILKHQLNAQDWRLPVLQNHSWSAICRIEHANTLNNGEDLKRAVEKRIIYH